MNINMSELFDKLTYDMLEQNLQASLDKTSIFKQVNVNKKNIIINIKNSKYHISIFRDQWNDYQKNTNLAEKLFHVTNEKTQCSTYFVVDTELQIKKPSNFSYEQPEFGFNKSTRKPCVDDEINNIIGQFEVLVQKIANTESDYYQKYLKYKEKYLQLKEQLKQLYDKY